MNANDQKDERNFPDSIIPGRREGVLTEEDDIKRWAEKYSLASSFIKSVAQSLIDDPSPERVLEEELNRFAYISRILAGEILSSMR